MGIVSIIMPIYNVEEHLSRAIESALQQTSPEWELILVNDGSTDESGRICEKYKEKDSRIRVIHQKNQGSGPARNAGLDKARGEYIYFADPDDYFEPTLIQDNLKIMEETNPEIIVFGFYEHKVLGNRRIIEKVPLFNSVQTTAEFRNTFVEYYSFHPYALWNKFYKKSYLLRNRCRFTDQKLGQDALFNLSIIQHLKRMEVNPKAYYHYIQHEGSAVNRYRKNRFELEFVIANQFEQVMEYWQKEKQYKDLIIKEYWNTVYLELVNLGLAKDALNKKEMLKRMDNITAYPPIKRVLQYYPLQKEKNKFVKLLVLLMSRKKFKSAIFLMRKRLLIEKKFYPVFFWAEQKFSDER